MEKEHNLVLVYPYGIHNDHYTPFYDDFIKNYLLKYLTNTKITLLVDRSEAVNIIEKRFGKDVCGTVMLFRSNDIWLRDWMPVCISNNKNPRFAKPKYQPRYLSKYEKNNISDCNMNGIKVAGEFGQLVNAAPIIMDGGTFVHNFRGTALTTNRIISDNEDLSIDEIKEIIKEKFVISKSVILPVEPGDVTGHVDGTARFINEDTIIVGDYPPGYREGHEFSKKIRNILEKELPDFRIIPLRNEVPEDLNKSVLIPSATGNHVNFLLIENKLFMPDFELNSDDIAYETLAENLEGIEIIRVKSKYLTRISRDGGVLNCITWQF
jgi:agmatine deiminase